MAPRRTSALAAVLIILASMLASVRAEDPYLFFTWNVSYGTASPLGIPQQVILINGELPGPRINCSSNNNIVINLFNNLDVSFLLTWNGIQQRKNSWQEGMLGTNCPIAPGTNFTYHFQVKDQIGSFFYFPTIGMQRAVGGFGGIRVNSRLLIPVPFDAPADDFTVLMGDWYTKSHATLAGFLDRGRSLARPAGVLMNGRTGKDSAGKDDEPMFFMEAGLTYRYRICNVGIKTSLNFRFQGHMMKLVEIDGSHTMQNNYDSLDIHAGQCMSVLVNADQEPGDYYMVASTRFTKYSLLATGVVRYNGSSRAPFPSLPESPVGWTWSLNQWRTFRWNLTASAARPNPQGSYHYGGINITRAIILRARSGVDADGKARYAINGVSHRDGATPVKLAQYFGVSDKVFEYDLIGDKPPFNNSVVVAPNVLNATFRTFIEIIFENPEKSINSFHVDGYSFFPVGMGSGRWTPANRRSYNLLDTVSRHTIQVYPNSWSAIMLTFDNAGMWNVRSEMWEKFYLGQQLYVSVVSPARSLRDEYDIPANAILCGDVVGLPTPPPYTA